MTATEIEAALALRKCAIVEDAGDFALVYPYGYEGRARSHDLTAKTRAAALQEAWDWLHPEARMMERIEIVQRVVAMDFGTTQEALCNGGRPEPLATARRVAMALAAELAPASTYVVGHAFNREHNSVMYAQTSIADQCAIDERFAARVGALRQACVAAIATHREKGKP